MHDSLKPTSTDVIGPPAIKVRREGQDIALSANDQRLTLTLDQYASLSKVLADRTFTDGERELKP